MNPVDEKIIKLISILRFEGKISTIKEFCDEIQMVAQSYTKIKKGTIHFTVAQIQLICNAYNVNPNWIFGFDKNVYRNKK